MLKNSTEPPTPTKDTLIDQHRRDDNYEVNLAQARVFAAGLAEHIDKCTASIEIAQSRAFRARADKALTRARDLEAQAGSLRQELYEMYRQIDKMSERFPELRGDSVFRD